MSAAGYLLSHPGGTPRANPDLSRFTRSDRRTRWNAIGIGFVAGARPAISAAPPDLRSGRLNNLRLAGRLKDVRLTRVESAVDHPSLRSRAPIAGRQLPSAVQKSG